MFFKIKGWDRLTVNWLSIYRCGNIYNYFHLFSISNQYELFPRKCILFLHIQEILNREVSKKWPNIEWSQWKAMESSPLLSGRNNSKTKWEACLLEQCYFWALHTVSQQFLRSYWFLLRTICLGCNYLWFVDHIPDTVTESLQMPQFLCLQNEGSNPWHLHALLRCFKD